MKMSIALPYARILRLFTLFALLPLGQMHASQQASTVEQVELDPKAAYQQNLALYKALGGNVIGYRGSGSRQAMQASKVTLSPGNDNSFKMHVENEEGLRFKVQNVDNIGAIKFMQNTEHYNVLLKNKSNNVLVLRTTESSPGYFPVWLMLFKNVEDRQEVVSILSKNVPLEEAKTFELFDKSQPRVDDDQPTRPFLTLSRNQAIGAGVVLSTVFLGMAGTIVYFVVQKPQPNQKAR